MPTINNETVIGSGYVTYRNARPQLLSNGWIVAAVYISSATRLQFRVKKTSAGVWEDLAFLTASNVLSWSLAVKGTRVYATLHTSSSNATSFLNFDATSVLNGTSLSATVIDSTSSAGAFNGEDLGINDAGTELHHVFAAKSSSYLNSFNLRYMKGTISGSSVSWSSVNQLTTYNDSTSFFSNPVISVKSDNNPVIISATNYGTYREITSYRYTGASWDTPVTITTNSSSYDQNNTAQFFVPQSINGLTNGRLWVAWNGKDSIDSAKFNIWTAYSDNGGISWTGRTKQTSGNTYDQIAPTLSVDRMGKLLLYWNGDEDASGNTVTVTKEKIYNAGSWGTTTSLSGDNHYNVSALNDRTFTYSLNRSMIIRYYGSGVRFTGNYYLSPAISPDAGDLSNKTTPTVLSYTVTPDSGKTVTSIVEQVNGVTINTFANPASLSRTFVIPQSTWDALKYYTVHTITITGSDSGGTSNTQTYTFTKTLANDASLLEGAKASKDGKDRISTKRDVLAGQVGLATGSTFDAISAQLASGNAFMKIATGQVTSGTTSPFYITVSGLSFQPKIVIWSTSAGTRIGMYVSPTYTGAIDNRFVANVSTTTDTSSQYGTNFQATLTSNGFTFSTYYNASVVYTYIALG